MRLEERRIAWNRRAREAISAPGSQLPAPVLVDALSSRWIPRTPRAAVDAYWRGHPIRADRLARALAQRSGTPRNWSWRIGPGNDPGTSFRAPPLPYREPDRRAGDGCCVVCGQPVYRLGWHADEWGAGEPNQRAAWHACCVVAWKLWTAPSSHRQLLSKLQGRRCALSGRRLLRSAEVDHRVPLFRVWRDHRDLPWPDLLAFWGTPNLQVINIALHSEKSTGEAQERALVRHRTPSTPAADQPVWAAGKAA